MAFAGLAFVVLVQLRVYPFSAAGILLDVDWIYRRAVPAALDWARRLVAAKQQQLGPVMTRVRQTIWAWLGLQLADDGRRGRFTPTGRMALAATVMLVVYLMLYYSGTRF